MKTGPIPNEPGRYNGGEIEPSGDPWMHRSAGMKCGTCMWYVQKVGNPADARGAIGRCRRHAPTMNGYPAVFTSDWCGDHKLDEKKI